MIKNDIFNDSTHKLVTVTANSMGFTNFITIGLFISLPLANRNLLSRLEYHQMFKNSLLSETGSKIIRFKMKCGSDSIVFSLCRSICDSIHI